MWYVLHAQHGVWTECCGNRGQWIHLEVIKEGFNKLAVEQRKPKEPFRVKVYIFSKTPGFLLHFKENLYFTLWPIISSVIWLLLPRSPTLLSPISHFP